MSFFWSVITLLSIQQYSYYHKLPLFGMFLVFWQPERRIHSAQRQQQMWSTELGVFFKFASKNVFRSKSSWLLGTWTSVRTLSASLLASTITSSGVLVLLTGSPVATTPSSLSRSDYLILSARLRGSIFSKLGLRQQQLALSSGLSH